MLGDRGLRDGGSFLQSGNDRSGGLLPGGEQLQDLSAGGVAERLEDPVHTQSSGAVSGGVVYMATVGSAASCAAPASSPSATAAAAQPAPASRRNFTPSGDAGKAAAATTSSARTPR
jgi:hypothetical protein